MAATQHVTGGSHVAMYQSQKLRVMCRTRWTRLWRSSQSTCDVCVQSQRQKNWLYKFDGLITEASTYTHDLFLCTCN